MVSLVALLQVSSMAPQVPDPATALLLQDPVTVLHMLATVPAPRLAMVPNPAMVPDLATAHPLPDLAMANPLLSPSTANPLRSPSTANPLRSPSTANP